MSAGPPVLQVTGLRKTFGSAVAVDDVDLVLERGGSVGIVGESGSGKTTTARILVGLERPTAGQVLLDGQDVTAPSRRDRLRRARSIQMIFQDPYLSFDPRLTIAESLAEPLRLHGDGDAAHVQATVGRLCDQVGLSTRHAASRPRDLSGGQRQRAAIARALGIEPRVLVLDEAVAALDVSIQAQVLTLLDEVRRDTGVAYVFVSHDLAVVRHATDSVLVMRHGAVVEQGSTEQVLASPQHPYTRLLLASVPAPGWDPAAVAAANRAPGPTGGGDRG